jgi:hypothetical protein
MIVGHIVQNFKWGHKDKQGGNINTFFFIWKKESGLKTRNELLFDYNVK